MLRIENLSVKYNATNQKVLTDISFELDKGEVVAILGASGCGKTTLLNTIAGLFRPGEVVNEGKIILGTDKIATVFQEPRLLPWRTVLGNVTFGINAQGVDSDEAAASGRKILKEVGLNNYESYFPNQISLGMKQRVNFARALLTRPELLLMDEPFSALDSDTKQDIIDEFRKMIKKRKLTTIFVTHNVDEANAIADRIITLGGSFVGDKKKIRKAHSLEQIMEID